VSKQHAVQKEDVGEAEDDDPVTRKSMLREHLQYVCEYCVRLDTEISYMDRALLNLDWACVGRISEVAVLKVR
jgi:hypothetical protein